MKLAARFLPVNFFHANMPTLRVSSENTRETIGCPARRRPNFTVFKAAVASVTTVRRQGSFPPCVVDPNVRCRNCTTWSSEWDFSGAHTMAQRFIAPLNMFPCNYAKGITI